MADVVELYLKYRDFEKAVALSGLPVFVAHVKLLKSGVLSMNDKILYSSESGRLGAEAELLFSKLVPQAVDVNAHIQRNHPMFDFYYGDMTIDVKFSSYRMRGSEVFWEFRAKPGSDFVVAFGERSPETKLKNAYIFLIPHAFIPVKSHYHISRGGERFFRFLVSKEELPKALEEYRKVLAE